MDSAATDTSSFRWDMVVFKVEERIFSVARHGLIQFSPVFEDMYLVGDSSSGEGATAVDPIVLQGYKAADFEALLTVLYPTLDIVESGKFPLTKEQWAGVLRLSRPWQMDKIRQLAIKTLSSEAFKLSAVEKVALARDHKVATWLLEGLTSLASEDLSPNALQEALGLRTAFRLAIVRNKSLSSSTFIPIVANGVKRAGLSTAALYCVSCLKPFINRDLNCPTCSKVLKKDTPGSIYVGSPRMTSSLQTSGAVGDCVSINLQYLNCSSCYARAFSGSTFCSSCATTYGLGSNVFISICCVSNSSTILTETLVRDFFQDELGEYDT